MITTVQAAGLLLKARTEHKRIAELPEDCRPKDLSTAYQCQDELTGLLLKHYGGKIIGYKTACTNESAQKLLNLDGPFYGPLLSSFVHKSPAKLKTDNFFMRIVEPEFAFIMASDLAPRDKDYTREEVSEAIAAIMPSIEIVDSQYNDWKDKSIGALSLIADNACNAAWVYGEPKRNWTEFDLGNHEVDLYVNGEVIRKGHGGAVMGHPLNPLIWLANTLTRYGKTLKAGDMITTGITCEIYLAKLGDEIIADFGPIGSVGLKFI
jgi:2-keto-4-pentenoate hydratase